MTEFWTNLSKIFIGVGSLIVLTGWTFGFLKTNDLTAVLSVLFGAHALVSGFAGFVGGPTRNNDLKQEKS